MSMSMNSARLETLLLRGLASGEDAPLTPAFWRDLHTEADSVAPETPEPPPL